MGWFSWLWGGPKKVVSSIQDERARLSSKRKCKACVSGLQGCKKANPDNPSACKNLELRLVTCLAEVHAKDIADEHRRCYTAIYNKGIYKGRGDCTSYEDAMRKALKAQGVYP